MGVSTNGILFYGFPLDEETSYIDDWEDIYTEKKGVVVPIESISEAEDGVYSSYWAAQREKIKEAECEVGTYCSGEYPMLYVAISSSHKVAYRGDAVRIESLEIQSDWREKLEAFCEVMEILWEEPGWYLVSYVG